MRKPTNGRKKIEIKRIPSCIARKVCFCKRRVGVFKKANELSILCGVEIGLVTFSPSGEPFSYGHPSIDHIIDRFIFGKDSGSYDRRLDQMVQAQRVRELDEVTALLEYEKKKKAHLKAILREWDESFIGFELDKLETAEMSLEHLKRELMSRKRN